MRPLFQISSHRKLWAGTLVTAALVCILSGCASVGPDYVQPQPVLPDAWNEAVRDDFTQTSPILETWWSVFDDPTLDTLIRAAGEGNLDVQVTVARIEEARARYAIAKGEWMPNVDGVGSATWTRRSEGTNPVLPPGIAREDSVFSLGVGAAWELDFWGRIRRSVESADASYAATIENHRDALVVLYADVAAAYIDVRSTQTRIRFAEANAAAQQGTLQLTQDRNTAGLVPQLDVRQAELNLASTASAIPVLRTQLVEAMNRLSVLTGQTPGSLRDLLSPGGEIPAPPVSATVGLPADLLRQRPDIRSAERELAAQNARIGIATANLYPTFALPGTLALESLDVENLFDGGSLTYGFGPAFRWNLFDGGRVRSTIDVEEARTRQALLRYENTVLRALEEVENAMVGLAEERIREGYLQAAATAASESAGLVKDLYRTGLTDFQNVLDMERALAVQQDQLATSQGLLGKNAVRLYRSLGGGWSLTPDVPYPLR